MTVPVVLFSGRARRHLRAIERYIAKKASPREAAAYVERIVRRCDRIALAPLQGERLDELRPGLRKTGMEDRVAILFVVTETTVIILSIAYGGRQFESDFRAES
jgi:toxin ParE1/3/4